jgi:hypothetical protein
MTTDRQATADLLALKMAAMRLGDVIKEAKEASDKIHDSGKLCWLDRLFMDTSHAVPI